jgi:precorrin-6B methylase 2
VQPSARLSPYVNKTVPFRFRGRDLRFMLSHALFSSFDVDDGTRLLLKAIAQRVDPSAVGSALDIGCGVGVIGACVAAAAPGASVLMQDRDCLAAAVARENCRMNGIAGVTAEAGLAFHGLRGRAFDLVTSNLPAKAGKPVLDAFLRHAAGCLTPRGVAAVVIVEPLAGFAASVLERLGCPVSHREDTRQYSVFLYAAGPLQPETDAQREDIAPYIRDKREFVGRGAAWMAETAHAIPDFDTLGHGPEVCMELLATEAVPGDVLFWNPGQGHLPLFMAAGRGDGVRSVSLASRDCLELAITARNLAAIGRPPSAAVAAPTEADLEDAFPAGSFDLLVMNPHPVPRVPWQDQSLRAAAALLRPGGALLAASTSTEMHRLLDHRTGFRLAAQARHAGCRAAILRLP